MKEVGPPRLIPSPRGGGLGRGERQESHCDLSAMSSWPNGEACDEAIHPLSISPISRGRKKVRKWEIVLAGFCSIVVALVVPFETFADLPDFKPVPLDVLATKKCLPYQCFGGVITKKKFKLCLTKVPGIPFPVPNPVAPAFHYYEVVQTWPPMLHGLYYIYTFLPEIGGTTKIRNNPSKIVYVDGEYLSGAHLAYRETCTENKGSLPVKTSLGTPVAGTIKIWGTGCKAGQVVLYDTAKCKSIKK